MYNRSDDNAQPKTEGKGQKGHARIQVGKTRERLRPQGEKPQTGGGDCHVGIRSVETAQEGQLSRNRGMLIEGE
jgi:hypothetical protein